MIIDHDNAAYRERWRESGRNKYNGAFYYSKEIVKYIIPNVNTDRNWITVNTKGEGADHSIVFIHNNLYIDNYEWLSEYKDLILVCGVKETKKKVKHLGKPIYLPLSVNVDYVKQFVTEKTMDVCFAGRPAKRYIYDQRRKIEEIEFPAGTVFLEGLDRESLLKQMAKYRKVYAVGRTAIEAKILGCEVLPYDPRYPDPSIWKVLDLKDAAKKLQKELDKIDGGTK